MYLIFSVKKAAENALSSLAIAFITLSGIFLVTLMTCVCTWMILKIKKAQRKFREQVPPEQDLIQLDTPVHPDLATLV